MSVLLAAKINDLIVLGTDSRLYNSAATKFLSDSGQKIFEIAPGVFFGWAGFGQLAQLQAATAAKLASEGISDLRELADRLDEACSAELRQTLAAVAGVREISMHSYVLAGGGDFIGRAYQLQGEKLHLSETDSRGSAFGLFGPTASPSDIPLITALASLPGWWEDGVRGVELIIEALRRTNPLIGGPTQMVAIDQSGARWVHKPDFEEVTAPASGTITALVRLISPEIDGGQMTIVNGNITVNVDGSNYVLVSHSGSLVWAQHGYSTFRVQKSTDSFYYGQLGLGNLILTTSGGGNTFQASPTFLTMTGLPSSNPGAGTKQFWYDPADGNRVKFAS